MYVGLVNCILQNNGIIDKSIDQSSLEGHEKLFGFGNRNRDNYNLSNLHLVSFQLINEEDSEDSTKLTLLPGMIMEDDGEENEDETNVYLSENPEQRSDTDSDESSHGNDTSDSDETFEEYDTSDSDCSEVFVNYETAKCQTNVI